MIGKNLSKYCLLIFIITSVVDGAEFDSSEFFKTIKNLSEEEFLYKEKEYDVEIKSHLVNQKNQCMNTEYLVENKLDQSVCFEAVKALKLEYLKIKFDFKNKIIINGFNQMKNNLRQVYQNQVKLIQNSLPESESIFEL